MTILYRPEKLEKKPINSLWASRASEPKIFCTFASEKHMFFFFIPTRKTRKLEKKAIHDCEASPFFCVCVSEKHAISSQYFCWWIPGGGGGYSLCKGNTGGCAASSRVTFFEKKSLKHTPPLFVIFRPFSSLKYTKKHHFFLTKKPLIIGYPFSAKKWPLKIGIGFGRLQRQHPPSETKSEYPPPPPPGGESHSFVGTMCPFCFVTLVYMVLFMTILYRPEKRFQKTREKIH